MQTRRTIYNDDAQGTIEAPPDTATQFLRDWVDRVLTRVPIDTFTLLAAAPDVCHYDTAVGEVYGARYPQPWADDARPCIRALIAEGTDPLEVMGHRVREHGVEFLAEMRMSDTHHRAIDFETPGCPLFTLEHPEWVIERPDGGPETAMDYSYPEVREHRFAILEELARRDVTDGLELNFNRWAKHFHRDQGREKAWIMTEFMGQVRRMLDEVATVRDRQHLALGVRVPATLDECLNVGLDTKAWVEEGYIDYLIVADWNSSWVELPVDQFAAFTQGTPCTLHAQMGNMMGGTWTGKPHDQDRGVGRFLPSYSGMLVTPEEARADARNYYAWGADGISFWNICCNMGEGTAKFCGPEHRELFFSWMNEVVEPERCLSGPRLYHYLPLYKREKLLPRNYPYNELNITPTGDFRAQVIAFEPATADARQAFTFRMADGRHGETLSGQLRFRFFHIGPGDEVDVDINGETVSARAITRDHQPQADPPVTWFEMPLAQCPPFRGDNELGLTIKTRDASSTGTPYMEELLVRVEP